ncbi:hypothetical protein [uncultured Nostoc sp.]|uniref:hypothetical protein n=1 Tax=uncultured Nostoc sp. TaxID=340711 RepID=UPI0035C9CA37
MMIVIFFIVGVILSTTASFIFGIPWLMPILGAAVPYPILFLKVRRQQYKSAFWWMLLWGVLQSIAVIVATAMSTTGYAYAPQTAAKNILRGQSYTMEMLHWIRTGEGSEGSLNLFLPDHLLHYGIFCILCIVTISSIALIFGTWMLNYMNFYVAELVKVSTKPRFSSYFRVVSLVNSADNRVYCNWGSFSCFRIKSSNSHQRRSS